MGQFSGSFFVVPEMSGRWRDIPWCFSPLLTLLIQLSRSMSEVAETVIVPLLLEQSRVGNARDRKEGSEVMELNLLSALLPPNRFPSLCSLLCNIPTTSGSRFSFPPFFFFPPPPLKACENRDRDCSFKELAGAGTMMVCERCTVCVLDLVGGEVEAKEGEESSRSAQRRDPRSSGVGIGIASPDVAGLDKGMEVGVDLRVKTRRRRVCIVFFDDFVDRATSFSPC
jgi:hypothetical protein